MGRRPTLHIKLDDLASVLQDLNIGGVHEAKEILKASAPYQIRNRLVVVKPAKTKLELLRKLTAYDDDEKVAQFNLELTLQKFNVHTFEHIHKGSKKYQSLKEATQLATDFAIRNSYTTVEGYQAYIKLAGEVMGKRFSIYRIPSYDMAIQERYDIYLTLKSDTDREGTLAFIKTYLRIAKDYTSHVPNLVGKPAFQRDLLWAKEDAAAHGASASDWVRAQFELLSYIDDIPSSGAFFGDAARERYEKYKGKEGTKVNRVQKGKKADTLTAEEMKIYNQMTNSDGD